MRNRSTGESGSLTAHGLMDVCRHPPDLSFLSSTPRGGELPVLFDDAVCVVQYFFPPLTATPLKISEYMLNVCFHV